MRARRNRTARALVVAVAGVAVLAVLAAPTVETPSSAVNIAACARGEVPNPAGYGCVPALAPGGAFVGAPSEEVLSACHGGSPYFCVDPYQIP